MIQSRIAEVRDRSRYTVTFTRHHHIVDRLYCVIVDSVWSDALFWVEEWKSNRDERSTRSNLTIVVIDVSRLSSFLVAAKKFDGGLAIGSLNLDSDIGLNRNRGSCARFSLEVRSFYCGSLPFPLLEARPQDTLL